ncbi:hypothetical protein BCR43DRAFT_485787, partial [Syncephalastrum racemosum]
MYDILFHFFYNTDSLLARSVRICVPQDVVMIWASRNHYHIIGTIGRGRRVCNSSLHITDPVASIVQIDGSGCPTTSMKQGAHTSRITTIMF